MRVGTWIAAGGHDGKPGQVGLPGHLMGGGQLSARQSVMAQR